MPLPTSDIKTLVDQLDHNCLVYLEKASLFCVRQKYAEVSVAHMVMQMLDDRGSELNRLLLRYDIDPIDWIRQLLKPSEQLESSRNGRPVFSATLLSWFERAANNSRIADSVTGIGPRGLVIELIRNPAQVQLQSLARLDQIQLDDRSESFDYLFDSDEQDITAVTDDTLLMSSEEIAESNSAPATSDDLDSLQISGYRILEKIGAGGMANVYKANHLGLDRDVALKVLKSRSGSESDESARFLREARIVAKLSHPNIVQIHDVSQQGILTYLAMELITGGELSNRLESGFSLDEIITILRQVLAALQSAHNQNYIHRDIKPANILFRENGSIVLTDFGIARSRVEDSGLTIAGSVLGTPSYMSPEQAQGNELDHRSDLYSVGVMFYQMLEGKLPYVGESAMGTAMKQILDPVPMLSPEWAFLQHFLNQAMSKCVDDRFQTGQEMLEALEKL